MYDYLIKNGMVIDGSGKDAVKQDIAILKGKSKNKRKYTGRCERSN